MGSGVVTLAVPEAIYPILAVKLNEPVIRPLPSDPDGKFSADAADELFALAARADALLIGCRIGAFCGIGRIGCAADSDITMPDGRGCRWHKCTGGA